MGYKLYVTFASLMVILSSSLHAQVQFISPLQFGILQLHGDHADLRLHAIIPPGMDNFQFKLTSDTASSKNGFSTLSIIGNEFDTLLSVPNSRINYTLFWRADSGGVEDSGKITRLTPGHIIGIAGQSNAQGYCWQMVVNPIGDIRMLRDDSAWDVAGEPTGNVAGGPWIVMANMLFARIGDSLPIGIVNVAIGGTGLLYNYDTTVGQWLRNPSNPEDMSSDTFSVYGKALRQFRHAGSELELLTWIQGEADGGYGGCSLPQTYQMAFTNLIEEFESDLSDSFHVYHLQIGGDAGGGAWIGSYPQVREAEQILPPSTIVGTGLGLALWDGRYHYDVPSLTSIGQMFAGAILKEQFGINTAMYPPLMPDTIGAVDSITDGSIAGRYCFSVGWSRGSIPSKIVMLTNAQYFALYKDGVFLDTSLVWCRLSPRDSSRILVGLRNDSITPGHAWYITYDAAAESDRAPLATIDAISGDTIFGAAFYELPVHSDHPLSVKSDEIASKDVNIIPNPTTGEFSIDASQYTGPIEATLMSETGEVVWQKPVPADHPDVLTFDLDNESSGCYMLRLSNGEMSHEWKFILEK